MDASKSDVERFRPHPDVVWRDVDGEIVLLNVETGHYFGLDPIGGRIWTLIQADAAGVTLESLCQAVLAEFDVDPPTAVADLTALIDQLKAHHLIVTG